MEQSSQRGRIWLRRVAIVVVYAYAVIGVLGTLAAGLGLPFFVLSIVGYMALRSKSRNLGSRIAATIGFALVSIGGVVLLANDTVGVHQGLLGSLWLGLLMIVSPTVVIFACWKRPPQPQVITEYRKGVSVVVETNFQESQSKKGHDFPPPEEVIRNAQQRAISDLEREETMTLSSDPAPDEIAPMEIHLRWPVIARVFFFEATPLFAAVFFDTLLIKIALWAVSLWLSWAMFRAWGDSAGAILLGLLPVYIYFEMNDPPSWLAFGAVVWLIFQFRFIRRRIDLLCAWRDRMRDAHP